MAMASQLQEAVEIVEKCKVSPLIHPLNSSSLPLTFLDLIWLNFPAVERIYFYQSTDAAAPSFFHSLILPTLKHSLSATLLHFPPLAGNVTWPSDSPKPFVLYAPDNGVSLTVAASNADFNYLTSHEIRDSSETYPYVPQLPSFETEAPVLALQITLFPNKGFSIGYAFHHAVFDGKSIAMFMKAWAYLCKQIKHGETQPSLLPELTPSFDRTVVQDPSRKDMLFLETWAAITGKPRSLKLLPHLVVNNMVLSTFELTREDINKLKTKMSSELAQNNPVNHHHLSSFVVACAYVLVCRQRARTTSDSNRIVTFAATIDCRNRLDPPLPDNYFGNCISTSELVLTGRDLMEANAVSVVAERLSGAIKGLGKGEALFEGVDRTLLKIKNKERGDEPPIGVAGSPRFELYGIDFGWGRPKKTEVTSIDRTGAISLAESREGGGGVEISLAMTRADMKVFASLFSNGLQDL